MKSINFSAVDLKWQKEWEKAKLFEAKEDTKKKKYYVLEMYPYPSANGLHMGHAFNYTLGDILARYKRMSGFSVLHPMGFDSFGLPAENAAIKDGTHPQKYTDKAIENFVRQQKALGLSYDWSRKIQSHDPGYYGWNQYLFLQLLKQGLVYRKESGVNWCSKCESVLANEQVHDGKCWRHKDTIVAVKNLEQWFVKTTKYAEELLRDVDKLDWPERIKIMQRNWIGKSEGAEIDFEVNGVRWPVFTTRADTLFGVTFLVVSAQHVKLNDLVTPTQKKEVVAFLKKIKSTKQEDFDKTEKEGVFTGSYAIHPLTGKKIPIWAGNFVVADYGSGMVMGVPAHDERDHAFAKKYGLDIKQVVSSGAKILSEAYTGVGKLIHSESFDGLDNNEAREHIIIALHEKKMGRKITQYKLRDWLISRQRYWGTPIPIIYCDDCGAVPVPEKDLPVLLPQKVVFGKGNPLLSNDKFVNTKCPKCDKKARRETDTMDTFFDSSWYFLRFTDPTNKKQPLSPDCVSYWMPVDFYTGGAEHACMHLIYARFFTKALRDLGYLRFNEPFPRLFNQGMVHGSDGFVMSKSRGNGIDPLDMTKKYGADTLRLFLVSMASPDKDSAWSDTGIEGMYKFVQRVWDYAHSVKFGKSSPKVEHKLNKTILEVGKEIESLRYNLAVIKIRALFDSFDSEIDLADFVSFVKLLSPFAPHIAEELGNKFGNQKGFVSASSWPIADECRIDESIDKAEELVENTILDIQNVLKIIREKSDKELKHVYLYAIPNEVGLLEVSLIKPRVGLDVSVFAVNDKKKYDPQSKSTKAKPGKPAIYVE
ncbi:MAG: leucine--tRNA ligase [Candidatus Pacearchaeota archaeon]